MSEGVQPVLGFAFKDLGFDRLVFTNAVGNERSRRIKEKNAELRISSNCYSDPETYRANEPANQSKTGTFGTLCFHLRV
jgi:hypothetical protein